MPRRSGKDRCSKFNGHRASKESKKIRKTNNPNHSQKESQSFRSNTNDSTYFIDTTGSSRYSADHSDTTRIIIKSNHSPNSVDSSISSQSGHLPIPRRPQWNKTMSPKQLHKLESNHFVRWRRDLAKRIESVSNQFPNRLVEISPFEKNLNVWRELWRVLERSQVLIVVVDARNPLAFIPRDLLKYIEEMDGNKKCLILINKADYLTTKQRNEWFEYFRAQKMEILFFSAITEQIELGLVSNAKRETLKHLAVETKQDVEVENEVEVHTEVENEISSENGSELQNEDQNQSGLQIESEQQNEFKNDVATNDLQNDSENGHILSREQLCNVLQSKRKDSTTNGFTVGFIGYPNVGKSSMINVLIGRKKVAMGALPGKTKKLQTLYLDDQRDENAVVLCDCPGLVFPSWSSSKEDMILDGVIPIDHLREFVKAIEMMMTRIGVEQLNAVYGMKLNVNRIWKAYDVLEAFCVRRKMYCQGKGQRTDIMRAAKIILKDYVKGKLLYNHPPPTLKPSASSNIHHCEKSEPQNDVVLFSKCQ